MVIKFQKLWPSKLCCFQRTKRKQQQMDHTGFHFTISRFHMSVSVVSDTDIPHAASHGVKHSPESLCIIDWQQFSVITDNRAAHLNYLFFFRANEMRSHVSVAASAFASDVGRQQLTADSWHMITATIKAHKPVHHQWHSENKTKSQQVFSHDNTGRIQVSRNTRKTSRK